MIPAPLLRATVAAVSCLALASCSSLFSKSSQEKEKQKQGTGFTLDNPPGTQNRYLAQGQPQRDAGGTVSTSNPGNSSTSPSDTADVSGADSTNTSATSGPSADVSSTKPADSTVTAPTGTAPTAPASTPYARPVPGKPGFVYPPGADAKLENMLDVTGFPPNKKMRDPRTGKEFLVP